MVPTTRTELVGDIGDLVSRGIQLVSDASGCHDKQEDFHCQVEFFR